MAFEYAEIIQKLIDHPSVDVEDEYDVDSIDGFEFQDVICEIRADNQQWVDIIDDLLAQYFICPECFQELKTETVREYRDNLGGPVAREEVITAQFCECGFRYEEF